MIKCLCDIQYRNGKGRSSVSVIYSTGRLRGVSSVSVIYSTGRLRRDQVSL